jgi:hypothetical protein
MDWAARLSAGDLSETMDDLRDEEQCLQHLLATPIDPYRKNDRINIGEWVNRAIGRMDASVDAGEARKCLGGYGIKIERHDGRDYLAIANFHSGLCGLYDDTRWRTPRGTTGVWVQSLRRLPGAVRGAKTLYFGGAHAKATLIPLDLIPAPDGQAQSSFHT